MRVIQHYRFQIGTKIPFSDLPNLVYDFLEQQSLRHDKLLYYFEDSIWGACAKAVKACPKLGPIRVYDDITYLSNIEDGTGCTEKEIIALMPKIYRRFGFNESYILFQNIDFFARRVPAAIQMPGKTPSCVKGSGIVLYRDAVFPRQSYLELQIDVLDGENVLDASAYCEAMKVLLPGIRSMGYVECCMTEEEQQKYDILNQQALPLLERAREYFTEQFPGAVREPVYTPEPVKLSLAAPLKKVCCQYGFTYVKYEEYTFFLYKRTENGHFLSVEVDTGPYCQELSFLVEYIGAGFKHRIGVSSCFHKTKEEAKQYLVQSFEALAAAEKEVFPELDAHFPATPDWFFPMY